MFEINFVFLTEIFTFVLFIHLKDFIENFRTIILLNEDIFILNFFFKQYLIKFH